MDPLSISAGAITFIGAALTITREALNLASSLSQCKNDLQDLITELKELEKLLRDLHNLNEAISGCTDEHVREAGISPDFVEVCYQDLGRLKKTLENLQSKLQGTIVERVNLRIFWAIKKPTKIDDCLSKIRNRKATLCVALGVFQRYRSPTAHSLLSNS